MAPGGTGTAGGIEKIELGLGLVDCDDATELDGEVALDEGGTASVVEDVGGEELVLGAVERPDAGAGRVLLGIPVAAASYFGSPKAPANPATSIPTTTVAMAPISMATVLFTS